MKTANQILREFYLDYINNYLTIDKFAEHNEIPAIIACRILDDGKKLHEEYVAMIKWKEVKV